MPCGRCKGRQGGVSVVFVVVVPWVIMVRRRSRQRHLL